MSRASAMTPVTSHYTYTVRKLIYLFTSGIFYLGLIFFSYRQLEVSNQALTNVPNVIILNKLLVW